MANEKATVIVTQHAGSRGISPLGKGGNVQQPESQPFLSPYLCRWCRNGLSLNEAHENCLATGKFDRFWPVDDVRLTDLPQVPIREILSHRLTVGERQALAWFYLYLLMKQQHQAGRTSSE